MAQGRWPRLSCLWALVRVLVDAGAFSVRRGGGGRGPLARRVRAAATTTTAATITMRAMIMPVDMGAFRCVGPGGPVLRTGHPEVPAQTTRAPGRPFGSYGFFAAP